MNYSVNGKYEKIKQTVRSEMPLSRVYSNLELSKTKLEDKTNEIILNKVVKKKKKKLTERFDHVAETERSDTNNFSEYTGANESDSNLSRCPGHTVCQGLNQTICNNTDQCSWTGTECIHQH